MMAEKEKILATYDWDRTYGEPWPVFRLSALERLDDDYLDAVARRIERAVNPLAGDEGAVRAVAEDDDVYAAFWGYAQGDHSREHVIRVVLAALDRYLAGE